MSDTTSTTYRVSFDRIGRNSEFDQLVDHWTVFAADEILRDRCEGVGSITVWQLNTPGDPAGSLTVIGYAGPDPALVGRRVWWSETSPQGENSEAS